MYRVHIQCYTYNHSQYIEDAMNGFVMQETDFPFITTIVDDASTDSAPQIITRFFERHFDTKDSSLAFREETEYGTVLFARHRSNKNCFFAVVLLKENHHSQRKGKLTYLRRWIHDVPYVALCEGDDYWTDSGKIQKQVDYMESHPDCMLSVHSADWRSDDSVYSYGCQDVVPKDYSVEELILCGGLHHLFIDLNLDRTCRNGVEKRVWVITLFKFLPVCMALCIISLIKCVSIVLEAKALGLPISRREIHISLFRRIK